MTEVIDKQVAGVSFGFYTADDVLNLSAAAVLHPHTFDSMHNPVPSGLYDPRLGPLNPTDKCATCGQGAKECLGHMGHIRLTMPVYHPVLFDLLCKLMRGKCWWCHAWRVARVKVEVVRVKLELIEAGMILQAQGLEEMERAGAGAADEVRKEMRQTVKKNKEAELARRRKERQTAQNGKKAGKQQRRSGGAALIDDEAAEDDDDDDDDSDEQMEDDNDDSSAHRATPSSRETAMLAHLAHLSSAARNAYKRQLQLFGSPPALTSAAIAYRSETISAFLSSLTAQRRCVRCGGYSPRLRKDGHSKLFRLPLVRKEREANEMSGKWEEAGGVGGMGGQAGEVVPGMGTGENRDFKREARVFRGALAGKQQMNGHGGMNGHATNGKANGKGPVKVKSATAAKKAAQKEKKAKRRNQQTTDSDEDTGGSSSDSSGSSSSSSSSSDDSNSDSDASSSDSSTLLAENTAASHLEVELAKEGKRVPILMFPTEVEKHLELLWQKERAVMQHIWGCLFNQPRSSPAQQHNASSALTHAMFFIRVLGVPPSRFRPPSLLNGLESDHPHNTYLKSILDFDARIGKLSAGRAAAPRPQPPGSSEDGEDVSEAAALDWSILIEQWLGLQDQVNVLLDSSKASQPNAPQDGIRQTFEKKEGLFRRNMMGKRVNYAARSVISPDPFLNTNEIGVPELFATQLTFPEPVTAFNVQQLRQAVINGPDVHPGANGIEDERGVVISLAHKSHSQRVALSKTLMTGASARKAGAAAGKQAVVPVVAAPETSGFQCKRVMRHIRNGDVMLVNRQPTLHKPSMMTHRVRVLRGRNKMWQTIRMHYANCNTYNADFDGDEMNLHVPQNMLARAEAYHISNTDHQYLVPTDGSPLRGLIQDNVLTGVMLTQLDTWLSKGQFQQLLFCCLEVDPTLKLPTPTPAILKPQPLYSGKQLISTLLGLLTHGRPPLNLVSKAKVPVANWAQHKEEATIIVRGNDLVTGALDKSQFGDAGYGLVHAVYEMYGANTAGQLLSTLGRLFTLYLQTQAFTCGIDDMLIVGDSEQKRHALIQDSITTGISAAADFAGVKADASTAINEELQRLVTTDPINVARLDATMKGSLNPFTSDIIRACLPGGQYKAFPYNGMSLMTLSGAKGSAVNFSQISCLLGQQELEGKRVPMMATGKTLPSFRRYDPQPRAGGYVTDRFLTGIRPQEYYFHCMAGREGLIDTAVKTSRSGYLQRCLIKHLESLTVNYDYTVRDSDLSVVQFHYGEDSIDIGRTSYLDRFSFLTSNWLTLIHKLHPPAAINALDTRSVEQYLRKCAKRQQQPDPLLSVFSPGAAMGAVSESYTAAVEEYIATDPDSLFSAAAHSSPHRSKQQPALTADKFRAVMSLNYLYSLVHPGESVGILAAQSVGEPSTQMTLNTFHLAGHGGANVTLGIPRLREIIMTASQRIRTPIMELPVLGKGGKEAAEEIAARLTRLTLSQFLYDVAVTESVDVREEGASAWRLYKVRLEFPDMHGKVIDDARLTWTDFEQCFAHQFVVRLNAAVKKEVKAMSKSHAMTPVIMRGKRGDRVEGEARDEAELGGKMRGRGMRGDEDAVSAKERHKHDEDASYAKPDEEDLEIIRRQDEEQVEKDMDDDDDDEQERRTQRKKRSSSTASSDDGEEEDNEVKSDGAVSSAVASEDADNRPWLSSILNRCSHMRSIHFDPKQRYAECTVSVSLSLPKLLVMGLVESVIETCLLRSTPHIQRAFAIEKLVGDGVKEWRVGTDGVNFAEIALYGDVLDLDRLYSNDIYAVMRQYGVEAARTAITKEVQSVFAPYGISVDYRHLSLIADYMTVHGDYRALNRGGMDSNASAFQKMTFETSMQFLTSAALVGDTDWMQSPSACIVMGKPVNCGTGSFELLQPLPE